MTSRQKEVQEWELARGRGKRQGCSWYHEHGISQGGQHNAQRYTIEYRLERARENKRDRRQCIHCGFSVSPPGTSISSYVRFSLGMRCSLRPKPYRTWVSSNTVELVLYTAPHIDVVRTPLGTTSKFPHCDTEKTVKMKRFASLCIAAVYLRAIKHLRDELLWIFLFDLYI